MVPSMIQGESFSTFSVVVGFGYSSYNNAMVTIATAATGTTAAMAMTATADDYADYNIIGSLNSYKAPSQQAVMVEDT